MADPGTTEPLNRICVVGCSGTGKSTLTRQLGAVLDLPMYHLDALLWQADWVMTDRETEERVQREIAAKDRWIIDGNFGSTMNIRFPRAQAIIWLDLPTRTAVWGVLKRLAYYRGRWRPDMAEGCTERFDWDFLKWVLEFREKDRHRIIQRIEAHGSHARLFHITHRRQLPKVIKTLSSLHT
ncbi:MAG: AAA family ATPase [Planctomycetota bacterium]